MPKYYIAIIILVDIALIAMMLLLGVLVEQAYNVSGFIFGG